MNVFPLIYSSIGSAVHKSLGSSTGGIGSGSESSPLVLDSVTTLAAYSLRKLRNAYNGSAIRVRRSSDNAEQDIGFVAGELDSASLLSFCGAGNGFVTIWYDQSGNARNLIQVTTTAQPRIVNTGAQEANGITFDGTNDTMAVASWGSVAQPFCRNFVVAMPGGQSSAHLINTATGTPNTADIINNTPGLSMSAGSTVAMNTYVANDVSVFTSVFNGASSNQSKDGIDFGVRNVGTGIMAGIRIGSFNGSSAYSIASWLEFIVAVLSDVERGLIEDNQVSRYLGLGFMMVGSSFVVG